MTALSLRGAARAALVAFLLAMTVQGSAVADPALDDATAAFNRGDYAAAIQLLRPLAESGNSAAQYNLGMMYIQGKGVPQSYAEGAEWYRQAADGGEPDAQRALGAMYHEGAGVPENKTEAATWYLRAAEQGDATAEFKVAYMYGTGDGVRRNYIEAYKWFSIAATRMSASDSFNHDKAIRNRDALVAGMSADQIAEAQKLAEEWKPSVQRRPTPETSH